MRIFLLARLSSRLGDHCRYAAYKIMDERILAESYNDISRRHAVLSCDSSSAWLYLHEPAEDPSRIQAVDSSGCAFNLVEPIQKSEIPRYRPSPPPIVDTFASEHAVCENVDNHTWSIRWSTDGLVVVVFRDSQPWCLISTASEYGYSRAISADGPWGKPWCDSVHASTEWSAASDAV